MQPIVECVSPARSLSTARVLRTGGGNHSAAPRVLVKVGDGKDLVFEHAGLVAMHSGALLKAFAKDEGFRVDLQGVSLDKCTVLVTASAAKTPSQAEEGAAVELTADDTLQDYVDTLCKGTTLPAGARLFIRVQLPAAPRAAGKGVFLPAHLIGGASPPRVNSCSFVRVRGMANPAFAARVR